MHPVVHILPGDVHVSTPGVAGGMGCEEYVHLNKTKRKHRIKL